MSVIWCLLLVESCFELEPFFDSVSDFPRTCHLCKLSHKFAWARSAGGCFSLFMQLGIKTLHFSDWPHSGQQSYPSSCWRRGGWLWHSGFFQSTLDYNHSSTTQRFFTVGTLNMQTKTTWPICQALVLLFSERGFEFIILTVAKWWLWRLRHDGIVWHKLWLRD